MSVTAAPGRSARWLALHSLRYRFGQSVVLVLLSVTAVRSQLALAGTADEPTSELDAANRARVMALLRAEARRGAGVLVATHDPEAAAGCDAELRMDEGALATVRDDRLG